MTNPEKDLPLTLYLPASMSYLPVAVQFVETAATAFGLDKEADLRLALASEEIFSFLANQVCPGGRLDIRCHNRISATRVEFRFPVGQLNMGALNMTAAETCADDDHLTDMGLVIASRTVDRLNVAAEGRHLVCLSFEKEKDYPLPPPMTLPGTDDLSGLTVVTPDAEELKRFVRQAAQDRPDPLQPAFFQYPGKVVDMVAAGDLEALTAVNARGTVVGGILLLPRTERIVEIIGPYGFSSISGGSVEGLLLETCLAKVARTRAIAVLSMAGLPAFLQPQFETLGTIHYHRASGTIMDNPVFYRLLHEDPGCRVWSHPIFTNALREHYHRLFLAREIHDVKDLGETRGGASIFAADVKRERSEITLRPLWPGDDAEKNVQGHLACLRAEAFQNIFFELDLGIPWHASLIPTLLEHSFRHELILPFAGQADIAVFQYHAASRS